MIAKWALEAAEAIDDMGADIQKRETELKRMRQELVHDSPEEREKLRVAIAELYTPYCEFQVSVSHVEGTLQFVRNALLTAVEELRRASDIVGDESEKGSDE